MNEEASLIMIPKKYSTSETRFITDIIDSDTECILSDSEESEILFYLCCK